MCSTTSKAVQTPEKKKVVDITPPVVPTHSLQAYLDKAYAETVAAGKLGTQPAGDTLTKLHVPLSLFVHAKSGSHHYAGIHDEEMHFSASLLKVAAMYSAFALRDEARALAASPPAGGFANPTAFFAALSLKFKTTDALPSIQTAGVGLKPKYPEILTVTGFGGTLNVEFHPSFYKPPTVDKATLMYLMIVPSSNHAAGECIRKLGYAYINVKMMEAGFFDRTATPQRGIWLAGDYEGGTRVEVDSENDGKSAAATTSRQIARMFSLIRLKKTLLDTPGSTATKDMADLLKEANTVDTAWTDESRAGIGPRLYAVEGVKVGLANLKPNTPPKGPDVYSEGIILRWKGDADKLLALNLTGDIAVCWQNILVSAIGTGAKGIAETIEKTFSKFLAQGPP